MTIELVQLTICGVIWFGGCFVLGYTLTRLPARKSNNEQR